MIRAEDAREEEKGGRRQEAGAEKVHMLIWYFSMGCWPRTDWLYIAPNSDEDRDPALSRRKGDISARAGPF